MRDETLNERSVARRRRSRLLWSATTALGLLVFGITWALQNLLIRARFYPLLAVQGIVQDRGIARHAMRAAAAGVHAPVAVVEINEDTEKLLRPPSQPGAIEPPVSEFQLHPRRFHARVLDRLTALGARVVVFDIVFDQPDPAADPEFAAAIRRHGKVVLACLDDPANHLNGQVEQVHNLLYPIDSLRSAAAGLGAVHVELDPDKTIRRFRWWIRGIDDDANDIDIPPLGVAGAALFRGVAPARVVASEIRPHRTFLAHPIVWERADDTYTSLISYYGPAGQPAGRDSVVTYQDVLRSGTDPVLAERLRRSLSGKVVLIGSSERVQQDYHRTPVLSNYRDTESQEMPGVEVQAHVTQTVLRGEFGRVATDWQLVLLLLGVCLGVVALGRVVAPLPFVCCWAALSTALWMGSIELQAHRGFWLEPVTASLGSSFAMLGQIAFMYFAERRERNRVKRILSRHVGGGVADSLDEDEWPEWRGEAVELTLIFSDLQGFTSLSEGRSSAEICELLNQYYGVIFPVLDRHRGSLDKVMGDGLMVYFGWPRKDGEHARQAIRCALEMQEALAAWQNGPAGAGLPPLRTRIGIHTGVATVGEIGAGERAEFTVIGDVVNVAARLESMNKEFGSTILASETTRQSAGEIAPFEYRGVAAVRGRQEPMPVYSIDPAAAAAGSPAERANPRERAVPA